MPICVVSETHASATVHPAASACANAASVARRLPPKMSIAQRSRLAYEEQYALSRGQITIHLIELYKSLGGGLAYEKPDEEE